MLSVINPAHKQFISEFTMAETTQQYEYTYSKVAELIVERRLHCVFPIQYTLAEHIFQITNWLVTPQRSMWESGRGTSTLAK